MDDAVETGESNEDIVEAELAFVAVDEEGSDALAYRECRKESNLVY